MVSLMFLVTQVERRNSGEQTKTSLNKNNDLIIKTESSAHTHTNTGTKKEFIHVCKHTL